ncbi:MAG: hypothetical protein JWM28_377 [Chitinophagaceae bacterium]|nr:hypothetical protein [Chitinophagaceae bacterium]
MRFTFDLIILLAAIITGGITFKKSNPPYIKILPFFLLLIFVVEMYGQFISKAGHNNTWLYNLLSVVEFTYFLYFFLSTATRPSARKILRILLVGFPLLCLVNIFFFQGQHVFHTYTYGLGAILMVLLGVAYFYQLFKASFNVNLPRLPAFWISTAVIFFFTCSVSILGTINYVSVLSEQVIKTSQNLLLTVNSLYYILFIISFICQTNTRKY